MSLRSKLGLSLAALALGAAAACAPRYTTRVSTFDTMSLSSHRLWHRDKLFSGEISNGSAALERTEYRKGGDPLEDNGQQIMVGNLTIEDGNSEYEFHDYGFSGEIGDDDFDVVRVHSKASVPYDSTGARAVAHSPHDFYTRNSVFRHPSNHYNWIDGIEEVDNPVYRSMVEFVRDKFRDEFNPMYKKALAEIAIKQRTERN